MNTSLITMLLPIGITLVVVVVTVIPVGFILYRLWKTSAERGRLLQSGTPATGQIVSAQQTGTMINNNPQIIFTVQVTPPAGQPYQAQVTQVISMFEMASYQVGTMVDVRIDPQDPSKVAIVGPRQQGMMGGGVPMGQLPQQGYGQPQQGYGQPQQGYGQPPPGGQGPGGGYNPHGQS